jgi:hypothetical protein
MTLFKNATLMIKKLKKPLRKEKNFSKLRVVSMGGIRLRKAARLSQLRKR